jgi:hypothetical protein
MPPPCNAGDALLVEWDPPLRREIGRDARALGDMPHFHMPPPRWRRRPLLAGPHVPIDESVCVLAEIIVRVERAFQRLPAFGGAGNHNV